MVNSKTENGNGTRYQDWFEVYEIASSVSLIIGPEKAELIDTGCGIGNLRKAVEEVTDKPVIVINTHTHLDHLGGNRQFDEIAMFDHRCPAG